LIIVIPIANASRTEVVVSANAGTTNVSPELEGDQHEYNRNPQTRIRCMTRLTRRQRERGQYNRYEKAENEESTDEGTRQRHHFGATETFTRIDPGEPDAQRAEESCLDDNQRQAEESDSADERFRTSSTIAVTSNIGARPTASILALRSPLKTDQLVASDPVDGC
jgi:hypothetical protein